MRYLSIFILIIALLFVQPLHAVDDSSSDEKVMKIDLFVMSMCPYGTQAEQMFYTLLKEYGNLFDINIYFVASENSDYNKNEDDTLKKTEENLPSQQQNTNQNDNSCSGAPQDTGGRFQSLHGQSEVEENIRQLAIIKYFPDSFWEYLNLRNEDIVSSKPVEIMKTLGIDHELIEKTVKSTEGEELLSRNIKVADERKVDASPVMYVNGTLLQGALRKNRILRKLCLINKVDVCENIPICGDSLDCASKEGMIVICKNPEEENAQCVYGKEIEVNVTIINDPAMKILNQQEIEKAIKSTFSKANIVTKLFNTPGSKALLKKYSAEFIPTVIIEKNLTNSIKFQEFSKYIQKRGDEYLLREEFIGNRYYFKREGKKRALELFVNSISQAAMRLENLLLINANLSFAINYNIHVQPAKADNELLLKKVDGNYQLNKKDKTFNILSSLGEADIKEDIRQLCISKYNPEVLNSYLRCVNNERLHNVKDPKCLKLLDIKLTQIEACEKGSEGIEMLTKNSTYGKSLKISSDVAVLVHNRYLLQSFNLEQLFQLIREKSILERDLQ